MSHKLNGFERQIRAFVIDVFFVEIILRICHYENILVTQVSSGETRVLRLNSRYYLIRKERSRDRAQAKEDVEALINKEGIEYVSVRFTDLIGVQQHFTVPASEFLKDAFTDGMPFDGSSVEGFQAINESDMKLVPDVSTAFVDPFRKHKTLDVAFSIVDPLTDEPYSRDPRQVAGKAEAYLKSTGIADTASFAPEAEFFIFDKVRFENSMQRSFYEVDSIEAPWNSGVDTEEDGTPEHRIQEPRQARILPGSAD